MIAFIFDTETTDLISNSVRPIDQQPQIIEFFGHAVKEDCEAVFELEFFCDPGKPLSEEVQRITGIKPEQVAGQPRFAERAVEVRDAIESSDAVVAHNLSYDMAVVDFEMKRAGLDINWPAEKVCTVESTEHLKGHRLSLSALYEHLFGETFSGAHRARTDVDALTRCYLRLVELGEI